MKNGDSKLYVIELKIAFVCDGIRYKLRFDSKNTISKNNVTNSYLVGVLDNHMGEYKRSMGILDKVCEMEETKYRIDHGEWTDFKSSE